MERPNQPAREQESRKLNEDASRTGPGSGAGRGNDLPSGADTKKDARTAEGDTPRQQGNTNPDDTGRSEP
jgi:hypothetical protein